MLTAPAACLFAPVTPAGAQESKDLAPVADYFWSDGFWVAGPAEVHVRADGSVTVRLQMAGPKPRLAPAVEDFRLSAEEGKALAELVRKVDFYGESEPSQMATDVGRKRLRISLDGKSRETEWIHKPNLELLENWFFRFIEQTRLLANLRKGEGIREVDTALDHRNNRVAQPHAFRETLRDFIERTSNLGEALVALGALARIEEPAAWGGLASRKIADLAPGERFALVEGLVIEGPVSTGRTTEAHRATLFSDALAVVRARARVWDRLSGTETDRTNRLLWFLARARYEPALLSMPEMARETVLKKWQWDQPIAVWCLGCWGERGFDVALSLLSAEDVRSRQAGVRALGGFLYEKTSWPGMTGPVSPEERERVLRRLRVEGLLKLDTMAADPKEDAALRDFAADMGKGLRSKL